VTELRGQRDARPEKGEGGRAVTELEGNGMRGRKNEKEAAP